MLSNNDIRDLMRMAYKVALTSTDRSTNNGAILIDEAQPGKILAMGRNAHLPGYGHLESHHERPLKYSLTEHAERDVVFSAARVGVRTEGLTMVANWVACPDCARGVVLAGVKRVICHKQCMDRTPERWAEMVDLGLEMLDVNTFNSVDIVQWDGNVGGVENLNNGEIWTP